jgi:hypothetical protein
LDPRKHYKEFSYNKIILNTNKQIKNIKESINLDIPSGILEKIILDDNIKTNTPIVKNLLATFEFLGQEHLAFVSGEGMNQLSCYNLIQKKYIKPIQFMSSIYEIEHKLIYENTLIFVRTLSEIFIIILKKDSKNTYFKIHDYTNFYLESPQCMTIKSDDYGYEFITFFKNIIFLKRFYKVNEEVKIEEL